MRRRIDGIDLWVEQGGVGTPTLLLCHGAGCTGAVWAGLGEILAERWPGSWIVPDLRGHGRSDHASLYGIANHASDMAALIGDAGPVMVCGHSMGGLIGLALGTGWFGVEVTDVIAVGVRVGFTDDEIAQALKRAETPTRWFETRDEAVERFLLVSGLTGMTAPDSAIAASGVVAQDGRFRLAADIRAGLAVGSARTEEVHAIARRRCNVVMASGEGDAMSPVADLRAFDPGAVELAGLGHNAHVEDPEAGWSRIAGAAGI